MSNTTTVVRGWKLTRTDAVVLAFTDCDVPLTVEGVTYEASAALTPSEAVSSLGLAVDEQEVDGGLTSDAISEADLAAGIYDGATVEVLEIDWTTSTRVNTVGIYHLGEVSRTQSAFTAELRSGSGLLANQRGRYMTAGCDAELGDSRCGVNTAGMTGTGAISIVTGPSEFLVTGLDGTDHDFASGTLVWTSGANLGQSPEIRSHNGSLVGLWRAPLYDVAPGDTFEVIPGCDKSFETCRDRFSNQANHRGFPFVVGEEIYTYGQAGADGQDGGSRNG